LKQLILSITLCVILITTAIGGQTCVGVEKAFGYTSRDAMMIAKNSMRAGQFVMLATIGDLYNAGYIVSFGGQHVKVVSIYKDTATVSLPTGQILVTSPNFLKCGR